MISAEQLTFNNNNINNVTFNGNIIDILNYNNYLWAPKNTSYAFSNLISTVYPGEESYKFRWFSKNLSKMLYYPVTLELNYTIETINTYNSGRTETTSLEETESFSVNIQVYLFKLGDSYDYRYKLTASFGMVEVSGWKLDPLNNILEVEFNSLEDLPDYFYVPRTITKTILNLECTMPIGIYIEVIKDEYLLNFESSEDSELDLGTVKISSITRISGENLIIKRTKECKNKIVTVDAINNNYEFSPISETSTSSSYQIPVLILAEYDIITSTLYADGNLSTDTVSYNPTKNATIDCQISYDIVEVNGATGPLFTTYSNLPASSGSLYTLEDIVDYLEEVISNTYSQARGTIYSTQGSDSTTGIPLNILYRIEYAPAPYTTPKATLIKTTISSE